MLLPDSGRLHSARNSVSGGSVYSFNGARSSLSARSSISGRSGSLSGRSQSRSSSVSIRLPENYNQSNFAGNSLLPDGVGRQSRLSISSAWESFRGSMLSFRKVSKVFLVAPCSRHQCCLGCVSLRDAIPLICVAELVVLAMLTLIAVDFYMTDGKLFYTDELEGKGITIAICFLIFFCVSFPVVGITLSAWHYKKRNLYLLHICWQWTVVEMSTYFAYCMLLRVFDEQERAKAHFILPSAIVLSIAAIAAVLIQSWWMFVFIDAMFYEHIVNDRKTSASSCSSKRAHYFRGNLETDSVGTIESRRHSFAIPIVKLRKPSEDVEHHRRSLDTESLPGLRRSSVMQGIPEIHEVAEV